MIAYHFLKDDMTAGYGTEKPWPVGDTRTLRSNKIIPCERGYHGSPTLWDALKYAPGPVACLVELDDATLVPHGDPVDKYAARSRRLIAAVNVERELRLFAADCAEHVLYLFEREFPADDRPRKAIEAARDFANGEIAATATAAATAAATYAAAYAAYAAAYAAYATYAYAAYATYASVASASVAYATYASAKNAEIEWQREQFEARFGGIFDGAGVMA